MKCYIKVFCITLFIQLTGLFLGLLYGGEWLHEVISSDGSLFVFFAGYLVALDEVPFWNPMSFLDPYAAFFYMIGLLISLVVGIVLACYWGKDKKEKCICIFFMPTNTVAVGMFVYSIWIVVWYISMLVRVFS